MVDGARIGPPPDMPSLLLSNRIVYVGLPFVSAVTELLVSELLYLQYDAQEKPIIMCVSPSTTVDILTVTVTLTLIVTVTLTRVLTLALDPPSPSPSPSPSPRYINSPGTTTEQGLLAGAESEAFAVIDTMNYVSPPIQTVLVGKAYGRLALQPDRSPSSIPSRPPASPYPSLPSPSHLAPLPGMAMLRCYSRVVRRGCALRCRTRACLARPPSRALARLPHAPNPLHPHPFTGTAP